VTMGLKVFSVVFLLNPENSGIVISGRAFSTQHSALSFFLRSRSQNCHSEQREESAVSLPEEKQIPRFAPNDQCVVGARIVWSFGVLTCPAGESARNDNSGFGIAEKRLTAEC